MKSKQQKQEEAQERQQSYNQLTTQQKLDRATGAREIAKLQLKLKKESNNVRAN